MLKYFCEGKTCFKYHIEMPREDTFISFVQLQLETIKR